MGKRPKMTIWKNFHPKSLQLLQPQKLNLLKRPRLRKINLAQSPKPRLIILRRKVRKILLRKVDLVPSPKRTQSPKKSGTPLQTSMDTTCPTKKIRMARPAVTPSLILTKKNPRKKGPWVRSRRLP